MFDYETLKLIWWALIGVLLIGFAITDGFDMGVGALLPFIGKNDEERRVIINTIGPHWDGNQVWFITAGGAIFAAWPPVYAAAFSALYFAMLLVLFALFFRPVGFDYRSKIANSRWRSAWDWGLFAGGAIPAFLFGVAFGNLLLGLPFYFDTFLRPTYTGSFFGLLHPFALLCGAVSLCMLVMHGAVWLQLRTTAELALRARHIAQRAAWSLVAAFTLAGLWVSVFVDGYRVVNMPALGATPNVLGKTVVMQTGAWLANYQSYPWMVVAPLLGLLGAVLTARLARLGRPGFAFVTSAAAITGVILTAGLSMFPFIMPSRTESASSLTLWDATSSYHTLTIMFWAVVVLLPIVLAYTVWAYRRMWGRVTAEHIRENTHSAY